MSDGHMLWCMGDVALFMGVGLYPMGHGSMGFVYG